MWQAPLRASERRRIRELCNPASEAISQFGRAPRVFLSLRKNEPAIVLEKLLGFEDFEPLPFVRPEEDGQIALGGFRIVAQAAPVAVPVPLFRVALDDASSESLNRLARHELVHGVTGKERNRETEEPLRVKPLGVRVTWLALIRCPESPASVVRLGVQVDVDRLLLSAALVPSKELVRSAAREDLDGPGYGSPCVHAAPALPGMIQGPFST